MLHSRYARLYGLNFDISKNLERTIPDTGFVHSGFFISILRAVYVSLRVSRITPTPAIPEAYKAAIGKWCNTVHSRTQLDKVQFHILLNCVASTEDDKRTLRPQ